MHSGAAAWALSTAKLHEPRHAAVRTGAILLTNLRNSSQRIDIQTACARPRPRALLQIQISHRPTYSSRLSGNALLHSLLPSPFAQDFGAHHFDAESETKLEAQVGQPPCIRFSSAFVHGPLASVHSPPPNHRCEPARLQNSPYTPQSAAPGGASRRARSATPSPLPPHRRRRRRRRCRHS
eukprot:443845-Pleurochrysis_carterae.AAC.1